MSEEHIIAQAAPTLAGIKTGSLFSCPDEGRAALTEELRELNRRFVPRGLCVIPLCRTRSRTLLYVFRPEQLSRDLADDEALRLLRELGYRDTRCQSCLMELMRRLQAGNEFPHEIGLFLSYPPEDVRGFMEHGGKNCKCVGCWKVYGDEAASRKRFGAYRKCTESYLRQHARGVSVDRLVVDNTKKKGA